MAYGQKQQRARLRQRDTSDGNTEVLIDLIDQDKRIKVIDYLKSLNLETLSEQQEPLITLDVSTLDSKEVCDKIISFMHSIGLEDVSVSSAYNTTTELEGSMTDRGINSEDIRNLTERINKGEESLFELIVSTPEDSRGAGRRWRSRDVIRTITQTSPLSEVPIPQTGDAAVQSSQPKEKPKGWARKLFSIFKKKPKAEKDHSKIVSHIKINQPNMLSITKKPNTYNTKTNKLSSVNSIRRNNSFHFSKKDSQLVYRLKKENKPKIDSKDLQIFRKNSFIKLQMEAYTQTTNNYKKDRKGSSHSSEVSTSEFTVSHCSNCSSYDYSTSRTRTRFINLPRSFGNGNLPYYMNQPFARNPFFYAMPQNPFYQGNYTVRHMQRGILGGSCDTFTSTTNQTTTTTNTSYITACTRQERKKYQKNIQKICPVIIKKKPKIQANKSIQNDIWHEKKYTKDLFSRDSVVNPSKITVEPSHDNKIKHFKNSFHQPKDEVNSIKSSEKELQPPFFKEKSTVEKQLADIQEKLNQITSIQKEVDKINTGVDCDLGESRKDTNKTVDAAVVCTMLLDSSTQYSIENENNNAVINDTDATKLDIKPLSAGSISNEKNLHEVVIKFGNYDDYDQNSTDDNINQEYNSKCIKKEEYSQREEETIPKCKRFKFYEDDSEEDVVSCYRQTCDPYYPIPDPELTPFTNWAPDDPLGIPFLAKNLRIVKKRKRKSRCSKLCKIFSGRKKQIKEQLLQQKLDLLEMKTILTAINYEIQKDSDEESIKPFEGDNACFDENDYYQEHETGDGDQDIHFSLSRPKGSKKSVTFRTPLTD